MTNSRDATTARWLLRAGIVLSTAAIARILRRERRRRLQAETALERAEANRRRLIWELEEQRRRLTATISTAPVVLFALDRDGVFELSEGAGLAALGLKPGEVVGRSALAVYADFPAIVDLLYRALAGEAFTDVADVGDLTFQVHYQPRVVNGEVTGVIGVATDITHQHRSERRYRNLFERAPVALWEEDFTEVAAWLEDLRRAGVVDLRAHLEQHPDEAAAGFARVTVLDVNDATVELLGAESREQLRGHTHAPPFAPDELASFTEQAVAIWENRDRMEAQMEGRDLHGQPLDLVLSWSAPRHADGTLDLSAVKLAMVDVGPIQRARKALQDLVEAKDRFVASVSHELRSPITAVLGLAEELAAGAQSFTDDEVAEFHRLISDQAREVADIVEDLLVAARADLGQVAIHPEPMDLTAAVQRVVEAFTEPRPAMVTEGESVAWADPVRTRQVIRNLVSNALRHGGPEVTVVTGTETGRAWVRVVDAGEAIPEEARERIFEPYEVAGDVPGRPGSVGLGLTVSRILARAMDGDLTYQREAGHNRFQLTLPTPQAGQPGEAPTMSSNGSSVRPG